MMFNPMLSGKVLPDLSNVRFPVLASIKLDGWRCTIQNGIALTRTLLPIPNQYVKQCLKGLPDGLDGEIIVGSANDPNVFQTTDSALKCFNGMPDFTYHVFDWLYAYKSELMFFENRYNHLSTIPHTNICSNSYVKILPHYQINNKNALCAFEEWAVSNGYEGIMLRDPNGPYKFGRSTDKQGWLLKMKRFHDAEATVIGFGELQENHNEQELDARGYAKRSKLAGGMVAVNTLGNLFCRLDNGIEFSIGSGLDDKLRAEIWQNRDQYLGKRIKFKYQNWTAERKPRIPIFLGFRSD